MPLLFHVVAASTFVFRSMQGRAILEAMHPWLHLLAAVYHSDRLRPLAAALLFATGFVLALLSTLPGRL